MIEIPKQYDWDIRIASYEVGQDRLLRLSNQLKLQQEVGERHLSGVGLDFQALYEGDGFCSDQDQQRDPPCAATE